jgi:uncharacterized protein (UPF0305 family)
LHVSCSTRVELKPTIEELAQMVNRVSKELIAAISLIPRLSQTLRETSDNADFEKSQTETFYDLISKDEEILKIFSGITTGYLTFLFLVTPSRNGIPGY